MLFHTKPGSTFLFGIAESQKTFWLNYRKIRFGSRGAPGAVPLAYSSSAAAPPSAVANSSKYFCPMSTLVINLGSVSPPFLGL